MYRRAYLFSYVDRGGVSFHPLVSLYNDYVRVCPFVVNTRLKESAASLLALHFLTLCGKSLPSLQQTALSFLTVSFHVAGHRQCL